MSIRNVNGRNVYVLEPTSPTGKTTSGKNWATLYSDLRWQVWEEIQKNEARILELEAKGLEQQNKFYNDQRAEIQKQIDNLKLTRAKALTGEPVSQLDVKLEAARGLGKLASLGMGGVGGYTTTTKEPLRSKISGKFRMPEGGTTTDPSKAVYFETTTTRTPRGGDQAVTSPDIEMAKEVYRKLLAGEPLTAEEQATQVADTSALDAEIAALESRLSGLTAPTATLDTDLLARSQRAYERNVGVMGEGGGAFGLAPRPRRILPRVDQQLAQDRIDAFTAAASEEEANRQALSEDKAALLNRKQELLALGGESEMVGANLKDLNDQIKQINAELSKPTMAQEAMGTEGFVSRRPGEFLLRDRTGGIGERDFGGMEREPRDRIVRGRTPRIKTYLPDEQPPLPEATPQPFLYQQPDRFPRERIRPDLSFLLEGMNTNEALPTRPPSGMEQVPESLEGFSPELGLLGKGPTTAPAPQPTPTPSPEPKMEPGATGGATEGIITFEDGSYYDTRGDRNIIYGADGFPLFSAYEMLPNDAAPPGRKLPQVLGPEEFNKKLESLGYAPQPQAKKSATQRKDRYAISVVTEGVKLAEKPKKLERLAKTQADQSNRPAHIVIVDRLYETNRGKGNAFKMTYDEISRVFANEPAKRKEAHTYLVAKDTLEQDKLQPLA